MPSQVCEGCCCTWAYGKACRAVSQLWDATLELWFQNSFPPGNLCKNCVHARRYNPAALTDSISVASLINAGLANFVLCSGLAPAVQKTPHNPFHTPPFTRSYPDPLAHGYAIDQPLIVVHNEKLDPRNCDEDYIIRAIKKSKTNRGAKSDHWTLGTKQVAESLEYQLIEPICFAYEWHSDDSSSMLPTEALFEDMMTQAVTEGLLLDQPPETVTFNGVEHFHPEPRRNITTGPMMIVICRTSSHQEEGAVNVLHLQNLLCLNDFYRARRFAEAQDPELNLVPDYYTCHSIVRNGVSAQHAFPVKEKRWQPFHERRFIQLLGEANANKREVMLLVRGLSGHSVAPNVYSRIHQRWPNLVFRIAYAIRPNFIRNRNCALPLTESRIPLKLHVAPATFRGFYHSRLVNVRDLVDQHDGVNDIPAAAQILEWHNEEYAARTGMVEEAIADKILISRSSTRNAVTVVFPRDEGEEGDGHYDDGMGLQNDQDVKLEMEVEVDDREGDSEGS